MSKWLGYGLRFQHPPVFICWIPWGDAHPANHPRKKVYFEDSIALPTRISQKLEKILYHKACYFKYVLLGNFAGQEFLHSSSLQSRDSIASIKSPIELSGAGSQGHNTIVTGPLRCHGNQRKPSDNRSVQSDMSLGDWLDVMSSEENGPIADRIETLDAI